MCFSTCSRLLALGYWSCRSIYCCMDALYEAHFYPPYSVPPSFLGCGTGRGPNKLSCPRSPHVALFNTRNRVGLRYGEATNPLSGCNLGQHFGHESPKPALHVLDAWSASPPSISLCDIAYTSLMKLRFMHNKYLNISLITI
ncbi:hypothetical protein F4679DRAFT_525716 [Xylaria curta]|nr:hypothetical protein F4679DRAFT_525716 [Xylaria curta]